MELVTNAPEGAASQVLVPRTQTPPKSVTATVTFLLSEQGRYPTDGTSSHSLHSPTVTSRVVASCHRAASGAGRAASAAARGSVRACFISKCHFQIS